MSSDVHAAAIRSPVLDANSARTTGLADVAEEVFFPRHAIDSRPLSSAGKSRARRRIQINLAGTLSMQGDPIPSP
jgi:hypothetical protein